MKKVAIITIYDMDNYGNRLQNYAVQEILKKRGLEVETLDNINVIEGEKDLETRFSTNKKRKECFMDFNKNIKVTKDTIYHNNYPKDLGKRYDYFVIGSDQIWNYGFGDKFSTFNFAPFARKEKKISLSASFGVEDIIEDKVYLYQELKELRAISVRENAGKEIVEKITGRNDAIVLIDPTMILEIGEWERVMKKPNKLPNKGYILKYFLGSVSNDKSKEIQRVANDNNYEIVDVMDKDSFYGTGPAELLYLLKNASLIVTDSFHSCVFSVLFDKPFVIFERDDFLISMNSRLKTFLNKFNMTDRFFKDKINKKMLEVDYTNAKKILNDEKRKFHEFLDYALMN